MSSRVDWTVALGALLEAGDVDARHVDLEGVVRRWAAKVDFAGPVPELRPELGACWLWTAANNPRGYGKLRAGNRLAGGDTLLLAHRVGLAVAGVVIPPDLEPDHLCLRPPCVRPDHLELVTHAENVRRHFRAQTTCLRGHPRTPENVRRDAEGRIRNCIPCRNEKRRAGEWS